MILEEDKKKFKVNLVNQEKNNKQNEAEKIKRIQKLFNSPSAAELREYLIEQIVKYRYTPEKYKLRGLPSEAIALQTLARSIVYEELVNIFQFLREKPKNDNEEKKFKDSFI